MLMVDVRPEAPWYFALDTGQAMHSAVTLIIVNYFIEHVEIIVLSIYLHLFPGFTINAIGVINLSYQFVWPRSVHDTSECLGVSKFLRKEVWRVPAG